VPERESAFEIYAASEGFKTPASFSATRAWPVAYEAEDLEGAIFVVVEHIK
jgi:hypothetical protein